MYRNTIKILEAIENSRCSKSSEVGFVTQDDIKNAQLDRIIDDYDWGISPYAILGIRDGTSECSQKDWIAITTQKFIFARILPSGCEEECAASISIKNIKDFEIIPSEKYHYNDFHLDDMNATLRISLHTYKIHDHFDFTINYIEKTPIKELFEEVVKIYNSGDENESDEKMSYDNMLYCYHRRDKSMIPIYQTILNGEKLSKNSKYDLDGLGLTPVHYAIALGKYKYAENMLYDLSETNRTSYINDNPYGIMNYTMETSIISEKKYGLQKQNHEDIFDLQIALFRRTDVVKNSQSGGLLSILGDIGKALFGEVKKEISNNIEKVNTTYANKRSEAIDSAIAKQEELVESVKGDYSRWVAENEKLERMREKISNDDEKEIDEEAQNALEEIRGAVSDIVSAAKGTLASKAVESWGKISGSGEKYSEEELTNIFVDYLDLCRNTSRKYYDEMGNSCEEYDARYQVFIDMYLHPEIIKECISTPIEDKVLLVINGNYCSASKMLVERYSALKRCELKR